MLVQKHIGFWGNRNEVIIEDRIYEGRTSAGMLYNVHYVNSFSSEVISYQLTSLKWKGAINFMINDTATPNEVVLLLFILGYYTVRNVMFELRAQSANPRRY